MRGTPALALIEALIRGVAPHLPPDVAHLRARVTQYGSLQVWAVPSAGIGADAEFLDIRADAAGGSISSRGPEAPFGIGSLIPFLPNRLASRLAAIDALTLITEAVQRVTPAWPAPDAVAKAETHGDGAIVWLDNTAGQRVLPAIRLELPH